MEPAEPGSDVDEDDSHGDIDDEMNPRLKRKI